MAYAGGTEMRHLRAFMGGNPTEEEVTTEAPTSTELADAVRRIKELDSLIKPLTDEMSDLKEMVKAAMEETGEPVLAEPYVATLREKNKPASIDLISAAQKPGNDEHIVRAASMGLLSANLTALRGQTGKAECADVLLGYLMPMGTTTELRIERAD